MTEIKGKWGLVTGASRGIGCLAAECLAKYGCNLVLHSRNLTHTEDFGNFLTEKYGIETYSIAAELAKPDEVMRLISEIEKKSTQIDIILNNAGVQVAYRTDYYTTPIEDYTTSFQINTITPMMICYHFIPKMIERGFGRVVNTTSGIALEPEQAGYSASKAALDKVTIDIGCKLEGTNVMINLADPGWCRTDLGGQSAPNAPESAIPGVVLGVFADDKKSGRLFRAGDFTGMSVENATLKAMTEIDSPFAK